MGNDKKGADAVCDNLLRYLQSSIENEGERKNAGNLIDTIKYDYPTSYCLESSSILSYVFYRRFVEECVDSVILYHYNITTENCNNYQKSEVRRNEWSLSNGIYI